MKFSANLVVLLVACLHFYFLVLEMFFWTKPLGLKIFHQTLEQAKASKVLAANQGLYNGFLSAGLFWGLILSWSAPENLQANDIKFFFLCCVSLAGIYGAATVNRKIFYIQALPAILGILLISYL